MSKRYDVMAPRAKKDGGTFWVRVGTAFEGEKGTQVIFDALPLPDGEGRVVVNLFGPRPKEGAPDHGPKGGARRAEPAFEDDMDQVPF